MLMYNNLIETLALLPALNVSIVHGKCAGKPRRSRRLSRCDKQFSSGEQELMIKKIMAIKTNKSKLNVLLSISLQDYLCTRSTINH